MELHARGDSIESEDIDAHPVLELEQLSIAYGDKPVVRDINLAFPAGTVTAVVGPSGCGKTSILRAINRIIELTPGARVEGAVRYNTVDIYDRDIDPALVRRRIGMVFQQANPYPTSIWDNIAWGLHINGIRDNVAERVEHALHRAALWDEVASDLKQEATTLSGGQQQRLCIARAVALDPEILLFDEPTSNLDPVTAGEIELLIQALSKDHTIVVVTHDLNMAARVSDYVAFLLYDTERVGYLEAYETSLDFFVRSQNQVVNEYITRNHWAWGNARGT